MTEAKLFSTCDCKERFVAGVSFPFASDVL